MFNIHLHVPTTDHPNALESIITSMRHPQLQEQLMNHFSPEKKRQLFNNCVALVLANAGPHHKGDWEMGTWKWGLLFM